MNSMVDGFKLMAIGMGMVCLFLSIMVFVTSFMAKLLAPGKIVLKNMGQSYLVLYGEDTKPIYDKHIKLTQILKSIVMTELIGVGSIFIFPLWNNVIKYSLEAFKWTLRNSYLYLFNEHASMNKIRSFFTRNTITPDYFDRFLDLRSHFFRDIKFSLRCPFEMLKVYFAAIKYRKIYSKIY